MPNPAKKKFCCRVLHSKFTIPQQVFNIPLRTACFGGTSPPRTARYALRRDMRDGARPRCRNAFRLTRSVRQITLKSYMHSRASMSLAASVWLACAAPASAESVTLFRVFLNDGTAIVSYGEYARVGDRLVFSMPIGAVDANAAGDPRLHVVNLPVSSINWTA